MLAKRKYQVSEFMIGIRYRENVTIGTRLNASAWHAKITVPFGPPQTNLTQYSVLHPIRLKTPDDNSAAVPYSYGEFI